MNKIKLFLVTLLVMAGLFVNGQIWQRNTTVKQVAYGDTVTHKITTTKDVIASTNDTLEIGHNVVIVLDDTINDFIDISTDKVQQIWVDSIGKFLDPINKVMVDSMYSNNSMRFFLGSAKTKVLTLDNTTPTFHLAMATNRITASGSTTSGIINGTQSSTTANGLTIVCANGTTNGLPFSYPTIIYQASNTGNTSNNFGGLVRLVGKNVATNTVTFGYHGWRVKNAGASYYTEQIFTTQNVATIDTNLVINPLGVYFTQNKLFSHVVADTTTIVNGLSERNGTKAVNDDAYVVLPLAKAGWIEVFTDNAGTQQSYAIATVSSDGTVNIAVQSGVVTTSNTDTDGNTCILDNGTGIVIRNRQGGTRNVKYSYHY